MKGASVLNDYAARRLRRRRRHRLQEQSFRAASACPAAYKTPTGVLPMPTPLSFACTDIMVRPYLFAATYPIPLLLFQIGHKYPPYRFFIRKYIRCACAYIYIIYYILYIMENFHPLRFLLEKPLFMGFFKVFYA